MQMKIIFWRTLYALPDVRGQWVKKQIAYCIQTELCVEEFVPGHSVTDGMAWQWAETLVEIRGTLADIRGTTK